MKISRLHFIIAGILIVLILIIGFTARKTVYISLEGQKIEVKTYAVTIRGALRAAGIRVNEKDFVYPSADKILHNGQAVLVRKASQVIIEHDGKEIRIESPERFPALWLSEAEISLNPGDQIRIAGQIVPSDKEVPYAPVYRLEVRTAIEITLHIGEEIRKIFSAAPTLGQALWEAGIQLHVADRLHPPPETPLVTPLTAKINSSRQVSIIADGQEYHTLVATDTVGEALAETGFALQGLDYSVPPEDQLLPEDGNIQVVRVVEELVLEHEFIPTWTEWHPLDDVEIDQYRVVEFGSQGLEVKPIQIRYENGVEVSRVEGEKWIAREPQPRIEGYGTKIVIRTLQTPDGPIEYWRVLDMYATSYHPCSDIKTTGRCWPGTAGGLKVEKGVIGVRYSWWKKMNATTFLYVPGYGRGVISDYGTNTVFPNDYWIDLGFSENDYQSWHQWVTVYFILPLPPPEDIMYILPTG
jgi:uncharacterized protein YabE (DUF348 family)